MLIFTTVSAGQNQILAKDVITCDDALYALREQIDGKKIKAKMADLSRVFKQNTLNFVIF